MSGKQASNACTIRAGLVIGLNVAYRLVTAAASVCSVDQKVKVVAEAKIPKAADAAKHKAGGGNVEIRQSISHRQFVGRPLLYADGALCMSYYVIC